MAGNAASKGAEAMTLPKKINDRWHRLAQQMIFEGGTCIDIADNKDDPDGDVHRYIHARNPMPPEAVLFLANKMRRTAARGKQ
jgi:hypothetical protein